MLSLEIVSNIKKRFKTKLSILLVPALGLSLVLLFYIYRPLLQYFLLGKPTQTLIYDSFSVEPPMDYSVYGVDVSHHQREINWKMLSEMSVENTEISFAFIKASEGESFVDKKFSYNWKSSKKNKILRGAYHFFRPSIDARLQAQNFIKVVSLEKGDLPPAIDIEVTGNLEKQALQDSLEVWLDLIEQHYEVKPIIYTNLNFYRKYLKGQFRAYPLWIAYYHYEKPYLSNRIFHFWQFTSKARINGISTEVDMNVFNFSYKDLKLLCKK